MRVDLIVLLLLLLSAIRADRRERKLQNNGQTQSAGDGALSMQSGSGRLLEKGG